MSKRIVAVAAAVILGAWLVPAAAAAQEHPGGENRVRLFGGFSFLNFSVPAGEEMAESNENLFGVQGNVTYYFTPRVGFSVDGAFNTGSILPDDVPEEITSADLTQTTLLFGPRFVLANGPAFTAEVFGAVGWAIGSIDVRGVTEEDVAVFERLDDTVFAAGVGASFDAMFGGGNWGVRLAQIELLVLSYDETTTNFRYSGGLVGRF